jgi:putative two-component system response regulator
MAGKKKEDYRKEIRGAYKKLKEAYRQLRGSHIEMVFRLALLAEYRDLTTGSHLVRISEYSAIIAEGLDLPKKEIELIRYASPMHDIGKVILPDSILKKEGKLTTTERELVKKHPLVAAAIFKNATAPLMKACGMIALAHHERFDGSGYPQGLKGKKIPLYGRIVGLADVFDALISERPYKKAYDFDKAVSMIVEGAGKDFDPDVVMAFVRNREKIKRIWQANLDIELFLKEMGVGEEFV